MYNKKEFTKLNDHKVLHKIGKHWVTISLSMLTAIGGLAFANGTAHASVEPNGSHGAASTTLKSDPLASSGGKLVQSSQQSGASVSSEASMTKQTQTVQTNQNVSQQAEHLHNQIIRHSLTHPETASSAARMTDVGHSHPQFSQVSGLSSATASSLNSAKSSVTGLVLGAAKASRGNSSQQYDNRIVVTFTNQNGKQVGRKVIASQKPGNLIDVTNPNKGGAEVPKGYILNGQQDTNLVFTHSQQTAPLLVHGEPVSGNVDIRITKNNVNGKSVTTDQNYPVSGSAGDTVRIQPNQFVPSNYYIDPIDHDNVINFNSDGTISPTTVNLIYDQNGAHHVNMNTIRVHYQDIDNQGTDIHNSTIPVTDYTGRSFPLKTYETNIPEGYKFAGKVVYRDPDGSSKPVTTFENAADGIPDVYIMLRKYVTATLHYEDYYSHQPISHDRQIAGFDNSQIGFTNPKFQQAITPQGFVFKGYGQYDPYLHNGETDVVYLIKNGEKPPTPQSDHKKSQITIKFTQNGEIVDNDVVKTPATQSGTPFNPMSYAKDAPKGYRVTGVDQHTPVTKFTDQDQMVELDVVPQTPNQPSDATVTLKYKDITSGQYLNSDTRKITGVSDQNINFPSYVPKGYQYVSESGDTRFHNGLTDLILVKPNQKPNPNQNKMAKIYIAYENNDNNDQTVQTISDTEPAGTSVNYQTFVSDIPALFGGKYDYAGMGTHNAKTYTNGARSVIFLKNAPQSNSTVNGTINVRYVDANQHQIGNTETIVRPANSSFNLNDYESATVPSDYHAVKTLQGGNINAFPKGLVDNVLVEVAKNANPNVPNGTISIQYVNSDRQPVGTLHSITRPIDTAFNLNAYEAATLPDQYHAVKILQGIVPTLFSKGTSNLTVEIAKNSSNNNGGNHTPSDNGGNNHHSSDNSHNNGHHSDQVTRGTIAVKYVDSNQQPIGSTHFVTNNTGTPFDLMSYEASTLPSGYRVVKLLHGSTPFSFPSGLDNLVVEVAKQDSDNNGGNDHHSSDNHSGGNNNNGGNHTPNNPSHNGGNSTAKQVSAAIVYRDLSNGGNPKFSINDSNLAGTPIDYSYYLQFIPNGYHFVRYGHHDAVLENNDDDVIYIAKNSSVPTPTPQPSDHHSSNNIPNNGGNRSNENNNTPSNNNGGNNLPSNNGNNNNPVTPSNNNGGNQNPNANSNNGNVIPSDHNNNNGGNGNSSQNNDGNHGNNTDNNNGNNNNNNSDNGNQQNPSQNNDSGNQNSGSQNQSNQNGNDHQNQNHDSQGSNGNQKTPVSDGNQSSDLGDNSVPKGPSAKPEQPSDFRKHSGGSRGSSQIGGNDQSGRQIPLSQNPDVNQSVGVNSGNGLNLSQSGKLPQTGESGQTAQIAKIMASLGISLATLSALIDRKRRHNN